MKQLQRYRTIAAAAVLLIGGAATADQIERAADVDSYQLAEVDKTIEMPRIEGRWLAFYDGREGRYVYDLTTGEVHDHIRQWSNIPYDLGDNYLIDAEDQNMSLYHLENKNRYKWRTRYEGVDHVVVGAKRLAMTWAEYDEAFKMHLHDVVTMGGRGRGRKIVARDVALADLAMEGDLLVWADYRYDQAGAYLHDVAKNDTKRLTEAESVTKIDTDGQAVVWKDDEAVHLYDAATGTREILFFKAKADGIRDIVLDGDWVVYQDDTGAIFAYHRPTGEQLRVTSEIRHQGVILLGDVSGRNVVFTVQGNQLWIGELPETVEISDFE